MAALMPMRYASWAPAGAATAAASSAASAESVNLRMSALLLERGHLGGDPPLFVVPVHRLDQVAVPLGHEPPLHLARRRDRVALLLRVQLAWQEAEGLDLFDAGQLRVGPRDLAGDEAHDLR